MEPDNIMTDVTNNPKATAEPLNEAKLIAYIANEAQAAWDNNEQPFFFSNLAPALKKDGLNYRDVTGEMSLVAWASEVNQDQWTVVRHPQQRSKVGAVPGDVQFSFEMSDTALGREDPARLRKKPVVIRFLEELAKLDQEELSKVNIPVSVIVKLLNV